MRLGKLDTYVLIRRYGEIGRDEYNAPIVQEYDLADAWAEMVQTSGREFLANDTVLNERRVVFRTHALPGVTVQDRIYVGTDRFNITEVRPLGRRHVEFHTVAGPAQ